MTPGAPTGAVLAAPMVGVPTVGVPMDAAAPPDAAWGPMLVVALVVVAVVAMILGFGRITGRRRTDEPTRGSAADGSGPGTDLGAPDDMTTDDPLPTDPDPDRPGHPGDVDDDDRPDGPAGPAGQPS